MKPVEAQYNCGWDLWVKRLDHIQRSYDAYFTSGSDPIRDDVESAVLVRRKPINLAPGLEP